MSEQNNLTLLSFVVPCYRSENTIETVVNEIRTTVKNQNTESKDGRIFDYEIVLVNDCSPDGVWSKIKQLACADKKIKGICLAKNFGQHNALMAGYAEATGDYVISLDDDGQTPADEVGKLVAEIENGAHVVYAKYAHKQHSWFRNFGSHINELMTRVMLGKPKELYISSYFATRRFVIEDVVRYENAYPYVIGLVLRTTKNIVNVEVTHREREIGTSGYTFGKLLNLWINGFTAFSVKPLRIATMMGAIFAIFGFLYTIYTVIKKFVNPAVPLGFSTLISAIMIIGGMLMLMLGMVGEYIGRIYVCMNRSPQYVIREVINEEERK